MRTGRLEAFSDGVIAIIITIMVLELKAPHGSTLEEMKPLAPVFLSYILSFTYVAIYWVNHHHMIHTVKRVTGGILWANLHLLFWLSLTPFATSWLGESSGSQSASIGYGLVLLLSAIAYFVLQTTIIRTQGADSLLAQAVGRDWKGKGSILLYVTAIFGALVHPAIAWSIFVLVALIWLIPDSRIERHLGHDD